MWAIAEIAKRQYFIEKDAVLRVERLQKKEGGIIFDKVLLACDGDKVMLGSPYVAGAKIKAEITAEAKADKVISYTYRRRKKSRKIRGHRQIYTFLKIADIIIP
jgi:large subunit ribosomal protein L21